jgi:tRNA (guanine37-N1)-methyltransferase
VKFNIFTIHPEIFRSFFETGLIASGLEKNIFNYKLINWRQEFGVGNYNQIDDKVYGGGSGMLFQPEPIYQALEKYCSISNIFKPPLNEPVNHSRVYPNNSDFEDYWKNHTPKKVSILLSPRGFRYNQNIAQWLTNFSEVNLLCGRYEGFDARVSEVVDLELSIGNYVLGGGEIPSMVLIESITRLLPGFLVKETSKEHDSFSSSLNIYEENKEFVIGKKKLTSLNDSKSKAIHTTTPLTNQVGGINHKTQNKLFNNTSWEKEILPFIEHPQYTRPQEWRGYKIPEILASGDHKKVQIWREKGWKNKT